MDVNQDGAVSEEEFVTAARFYGYVLLSHIIL